MSLSLPSPLRTVVVGVFAWGLTTPALAEQPSKLKPDVERGERLYLENCWHCHGRRALGDGPLANAGPVPAPPLAGRVPDDQDVWVTTIHRGKETMPGFGPVFDRHDARRVLVWLDALDPETGDGPSIEKDAAKKKDEDEGEEDGDEAKKDDESKKGDARLNGAPKEAEADEGDAEQLPTTPPPGTRPPL